MDGKVILICLQLVFFVVMLYAIYTLSTSKEPRPFHKWLMLGCYFIILAFRSKVELLLGLIGILASALIVSKTKKKQNAMD
jgi:chromate transport protein ChrA